jgi:hypothetical protein
MGLVYIDPSRRNDTKGKFFTKDCLPNTTNLELYFKYSEAILIKGSITRSICGLVRTTACKKNTYIGS